MINLLTIYQKTLLNNFKNDLETFLATIFLLASIQGFLLSALLYFKKANQHANHVLSFAIFIMSIDLLSNYAFVTNLYLQYPLIFGANITFPFIYGPIFYIYTKIVTGNEQKFRQKYLLHFLPSVIFHLYLSPYYFLSDQQKFARIEFYVSQEQVDLLIMSLLKPVSGIFYTLLSLSLIKNFNQKLMDTFSNIDKKKIDWLKFLITGTFLVWCIVAALFIFAPIVGLEHKPYDGIIYFFVSILIYAIGYGALNQADVFNYGENIIKKEKQVDNVEIKPAKYEKSSLEEKDIEKIKRDLVLLMGKEKLYLNTELTLAQLAEKLLITNHNLSEVINTSFGKNFYDFINSYRIEEFKERLKNPEFANYNLLAIAYDSGFSSKSSFNSIFKKYTNSTPSEYRKQLGN